MRLSNGYILTMIPDFSGLSEDKKEIWGRWIYGLKGGEYNQTSRKLHNSGGFCCLGVACDLSKDASEISGRWEERGDGVFIFVPRPMDSTHSGIGIAELPVQVREFYGLTDSWGFKMSFVLHEKPRKRNPPEYCSLAQLNDDGVKFPEIAQILEVALKGGLNA